MNAMTPEWRTRLRPGRYVVTVRGPEGLLLDLAVALERRGEMGGTYEDTAVPEIRLCLAAASESMLTVLATAEGIMGAQRAANHGLAAAATTEPAEAGTTNGGPAA